MSAIELFELFPNEQSAHRWFENLRWPDGQRTCPRCTSGRTKRVKGRKPMPFWCSDCRSYFSVKVGTIMESSKLPLRKWVVALYLMNTNLKGVSSMKLHRDLGVTQKTAWMMAQKIRECWAGDGHPLSGEVEIDETFVGGKEKNRHASKKLRAGPLAGKTTVMGVKQRNGAVRAEPMAGPDSLSAFRFTRRNVAAGSTLYTDGTNIYKGMTAYRQESVNHSVGEYVRDQAHTNGIESFWAMLKRGYMGTYHKMSVKHLHRYVNEFAGRANYRHHDTIVQMSILALAMVGKRMRWQDLTADPV
ncbi:MAG: IS1595 family transposase [Dehalococcoidia bacterium]|nr:IS1595 family transposase [Dehalococcoidia bacterium]